MLAVLLCITLLNLGPKQWLATLLDVLESVLVLKVRNESSGGLPFCATTSGPTTLSSSINYRALVFSDSNLEQR